MISCILFYRISNPLIYISNACGVFFLFCVNASQPWEESCNQRMIKSKEVSTSNARNKVCPLNYVFS
jgi:hypothetical protein